MTSHTLRPCFAAAQQYQAAAAATGRLRPWLPLAGYAPGGLRPLQLTVAGEDGETESSACRQTLRHTSDLSITGGCVNSLQQTTVDKLTWREQRCRQTCRSVVYIFQNHFIRQMHQGTCLGSQRDKKNN